MEPIPSVRVPLQLPWLLGLSKDQGKYNYYWPYFLQLKKIIGKNVSKSKSGQQWQLLPWWHYNKLDTAQGTKVSTCTFAVTDFISNNRTVDYFNTDKL